MAPTPEQRARERKKIRDAERKSAADLAKQGKNVTKDPNYKKEWEQKNNFGNRKRGRPKQK